MSRKIDLKNILPLFGDSSADDDSPVIIAGPCSAESREQVFETARELAAYGVRYFRAGLWKPRTRPGSFEGVGARGLPWLSEVRDKLGMVPLTEVATAAHLRAASRAGLNAFWIGARTSANPFAVQEIADALSELPKSFRDSCMVLVKNPVNPDLELWIGALQRIYASGVRKVGAIHRGFSAYGEKLYRNRPEWRIPIELKHRVPGLTLLCDPSHIAGRRELVGQVARMAVGMNFDGLIVEVHCKPDDALSDSSQQITPCELNSLIKGVKIRKSSRDCVELEALREEIDSIDTELISLLARRMDVARKIGAFKMKSGMPVVQPARYQALMDTRVGQGLDCGLSSDFMHDILSSIHEESVRQQLDCSD